MTKLIQYEDMTAEQKHAFNDLCKAIEKANSKFGNEHLAIYSIAEYCIFGTTSE